MALDGHGVENSSGSYLSKGRHKYDVFLSFHRNDTSRIFPDRLNNALCHEGLKTFRHEPDLGRVEVIKPSLLQAMEESFCAIVVLSENYASSKWCLDELLQILQSMKELDLHVFLIFHRIEPSDVRHQTGRFGKAFEKLAQTFEEDKMMVQSWKNALTTVADLPSWHSTCFSYDSKLIDSIAETVRSKLNDDILLLDLNDTDAEKGIMEKQTVGRKIKLPRFPPPAVPRFEVRETGPPFPPTMPIGFNKEKQDLLDSQGPRDYNKLNERMLDCYMSPKSMWDGIKALRQVNIHTEDMNQGRFKVGHFAVSNFVNEYDLQQLEYVGINSSFQLLKNDLIQETKTLYDEAARVHNAQVKIKEDSKFCGIKRTRADTWGTISEDVGRGAYKELDDSGNRVKRNNAVSKTGCSKGYVMPTHDLLGKEFQRHTQQILKWIKDEVPAIGIWGMGGSGKTALATHVHNKLLEEAGDDFDHIIWVTVSQYDNSIYKMQKAIARSINLDISDEHDVKRISGKLFQASKHKNCIVILDDVWNPIFLEEVGFPISSSGFKLILTTRLWKVCQSMNCLGNIVEVKPLDEEEGWDLFKWTLEMQHIESSEVEPIARGAAKQFEGLPLAIVMFAKSMKGKEDIGEWNHLLECLQNFDNNGQYCMSKMVLPVLKSSYTCLNYNLQNFFLYYALSVKEDLGNSYVQPLIRKFFYEGWSDKTKNSEIHDKGYTMLDELKKNSLLAENNGRRRMHTLLKVMAIDIAKENDEIMVKTGMDMIELPENGEWKEGLQKVCLTKSNIQKILDGTSPKCSKLSTLLLDCNYDLKWIPDDFFSNMPALKILDLSRTGIEHLPESVSNLECLVALLLSGCQELNYVPSLAKLQRLIELDLSFTAIAEAPCGLELLVNLKYLNLACMDQLKMSSSVISKMTNLQSLRLMNWIPKSMDVRAHDLRDLRKLENVSVNFCDIEDFNAYVKNFLDNDHVLKSYCLSSATLFDSDSFVGALESCSLKRIVLCGIGLTNTAVILPEDINELIISKCDNWRKSTILCHALSFGNNNGDLPQIEWLQVRECDRVEYLCCLSPTCLFCSSVLFDGRLSLIALSDLKQIVEPIALSLDSPFTYLRDLKICECSRMKILMTAELLEQLQSLETIFVESCKSMVEIVGENYSSGNTSSPTITLPKVRLVALHALPELTVVFRGTMICPSLKYFHAFDCKKLSPPHIEIREGCVLPMEMSTGYHWGCDNQSHFGMSHQQALSQVTAQAVLAQSQMHVQDDFHPSSVTGSSEALALQPSSTPGEGSELQVVPPSVSEPKGTLVEIPEISQADNKYQTSMGVDKPAYDGYNWRKYGKKQVKAGENQRSYYKCTHPNCPAKRKIERAMNGPITEIIYKCQHNHPKPQPIRRAKDNCELSENKSIQVMHESNTQGSAGNSNVLGESMSDHSMLESDLTFDQEAPKQSSGSCESEEVLNSNITEEDGDASEPNPKRRSTEVGASEASLSHKTVTEPKIILHTRSEVDILDDGFRWRKYGQKVMKGNPNPRSYYKCTSAGCSVRKYVERSSTDLTYVITAYEGKHNHDVPASRNGRPTTATTSSMPLKPPTMSPGEHPLLMDMGFGKDDQRPAALRLKGQLLYNVSWGASLAYGYGFWKG